MDPSRQIRLLIAPFFFIFSLIVAIKFGTDEFGRILNGDVSHSDLFALITISLAATLPIGFTINLITSLIVHPLIIRLYILHYFKCDKENKKNLIKVLNKNIIYDNPIGVGKETTKITIQKLKHLIIIFEQGLLYNNYRELFDFQVRAHTSFTISLNIIIALIFSIPIGYMFSPPDYWWISSVLCIIVLMVVHAWWSKNNSFKLIVTLLRLVSFKRTDAQV